MGMFNDFLKKIGLKKEMNLLEAGKANEPAAITRADELVAEAKEKFNSSIKVAPATEIKIEEAHKDENETEKDNKPVLKVFAEQGEGSHIEYIVKLETNQGMMIPISVLKERSERINLRDIIDKLTNLVVAVQDAPGKSNAEEQQEDVRDDMDFLHRRYKIDFTREMDRMVERMCLPKTINYQTLMDSLPKSIDISKLTPTQLIQYGEMLTQRLDVLEGIKTPEDAYEARTSLESFMKSQEKKTARGAIVTANLENLESGEEALDVQTIVALAKKMEHISNEDGLLYATYLKLEENRIIRKLRSDILIYREGLQDVPENQDKTQLSSDLAQYLDSIITSDSDEGREDIITYMIDTLQGKGIENYAKNCVQYDTRLKVFLKHNPIENQEVALDYITARMACFGQVVGTSEPDKDMEKIKNLRNFIETTEYKDEDDTESKKFLYTIAQIERDYIKNNYSPILHEFKKIIDTER